MVAYQGPALPDWSVQEAETFWETGKPYTEGCIGTFCADWIPTTRETGRLLAQSTGPIGAAIYAEAERNGPVETLINSTGPIGRLLTPSGREQTAREYETLTGNEAPTLEIPDIDLPDVDLPGKQIAFAAVLIVVALVAIAIIGVSS